MNSYNDIGISRTLDTARIRKLLSIGLFSSLITFVSDMILGWGTEDVTLTGIGRMLSAYTDISDTALFICGLLGLVGISIEGLSFFGIYRMIAPYSEKYAHLYRTGIFGWMLFAPCGFHVPVCAAVFLQKHIGASDIVEKYALCFVLPSIILFFVFFIILSASQIRAFLAGCTPYPKWCWVFSLPVMMASVLLLNVFGNRPWVNALTTSWISLGGIWMFGGLLITMKRAGNQ